MDHIGVGGDQIFLAELKGSPVIIKTGLKIGDLEIKGGRLLRKHGLPILDSIKNSKDYIVYPDLKATRKGGSLHQIILHPELHPSTNVDFLITKYIRLHKKMWKETLIEETQFLLNHTKSEIIGYRDKITDTLNTAQSIMLNLESEGNVRVSELTNHEWVINGNKIGNLNEIFELLTRESYNCL